MNKNYFERSFFKKTCIGWFITSQRSDVNVYLEKDIGHRCLGSP